MILAVETAKKEREGEWVRFRAKEREREKVGESARAKPADSIRCRSLKFRMIDMALGMCVCVRWNAHVSLEWYTSTSSAILPSSSHYIAHYDINCNHSVERHSGLVPPENLNICHVFLLFICCLSSLIPVHNVHMRLQAGDADMTWNLTEFERISIWSEMHQS